ncbi:MAG: hypothetical protein M1826_007103 [Phylliscum demangeonii]|nr:MAG: hypothetical protein M1826_007103 [Phylliscum demangeonii]
MARTSQYPSHDLVGLESAYYHIPTPAPLTRPECCCGRSSCDYDEQRSLIMSELHRDIHTAAHVGQALLTRHEAYVADAQREKREMNCLLEKLETGKRDVEAQNAKLLQENKDLLEQLEDLNRALIDSDAQVNSLTATIEAHRHEIRRLANLASRTTRLESQINTMELELTELQKAIAMAEVTEKESSQRWKTAEKRVQFLQEEVDRIEAQAAAERESQEEAIARLEHARGVDAEKIRAGHSSGNDSAMLHQVTTGHRVLSRFVEDLLQDNSSLQANVAELRDLLLTSNEETERLRDELLSQPPRPSSSPNSLSKELSKATASSTPVFHVHNHYYDPQSIKLRAMVRRARIKRNPGLSSKSAETLRPRSSSRRVIMPRQLTSNAATLLSATSVTVPLRARRRPSGSTAPPSGASTPLVSSLRAFPSRQSVSDSALGSSRPTTPDTIGPTPASSTTARCSPELRARFSKHLLASVPAPAAAVDHLDLASPSAPTVSGHADAITSSRDAPSMPRRNGSHESLLSISGMDIHTVRPRPPHAATVSGRNFFPRTALLGASAASAAMATHHDVMGAISAARRSPTGLQRHRQSLASHYAGARPDTDSLRRKLGGWVWNRWATTTGNAHAHGHPSLSATPLADDAAGHEPVQLVATDLDEALLRQSLLE